MMTPSLGPSLLSPRGPKRVSRYVGNGTRGGDCYDSVCACLWGRVIREQLPKGAAAPVEREKKYYVRVRKECLVHGKEEG